MSLNDFKEKIGWNVANEPLEENSLRLEDGNSVASIRGARMFGVHFGIYYKYNLCADKIFFPIVFTKSGKLVVNNEKELDEWLGHRCGLCYMCDNVEIKNEILRGIDYKSIRIEEIKHQDRLVFDELYDYNNEEFYGYKYIEV